jgi:hypothetical protein
MKGTPEPRTFQNIWRFIASVDRQDFAAMTISQDLIAIEKQFWTKGESFYRQNVDESCLVAFAEMAGVMTNKDIAATPSRKSVGAISTLKRKA